MNEMKRMNEWNEKWMDEWKALSKSNMKKIFLVQDGHSYLVQIWDSIHCQCLPVVGPPGYVSYNSHYDSQQEQPDQ